MFSFQTFEHAEQCENSEMLRKENGREPLAKVQGKKNWKELVVCRRKVAYIKQISNVEYAR